MTEKYREEVFTALLLGMIIALIISGVCIVFLDPILNLIHTPDELIPYAESYLFIILAGLPFTCLCNLLSGILRSIGNTRVALSFLAAAITMNIALDFLFIGILRLGTGGAAAATILSQFFSAICCFLYLRDTYPGLLCRREDIGAHKDLVIHTLRYGLIRRFRPPACISERFSFRAVSIHSEHRESPPIRQRPALRDSRIPSVTAEEMRSPSWSPRILEPEIMTG